jgi:hypothetical protein
MACLVRLGLSAGPGGMQVLGPFPRQLVACPANGFWRGEAEVSFVLHV